MSYANMEENIYGGELISFSIGSNMGDSMGYLQLAVDRLNESDLLDVVAVSSVYETDPVGRIPQDDFLNAVVLCRSEQEHTFEEFLDLINGIEKEAGRVREIPDGPRTLDIDVLAVGNRVNEDPRLIIPHPKALDRAFVIIPWAEVFPHCELPGSGWMEAPKTLEQHAAGLSQEDRDSVRKIEAELTFEDHTKSDKIGAEN